MHDLKERLNLERVDFRFFNDLTIKINLNYVWWGHYDFLTRIALLAKFNILIGGMIFYLEYYQIFLSL